MTSTVTRLTGGLLGMALMAGCRTLPRDNPAPHALPDDPHHHVVEVNGSQVTDNPNEGFALVPVPGLPSESDWDAHALNPAGSLEAVATCEPGCRVLVRSTSPSGVYELQSPLFSDLRPFSSLVWLGSNLLVFDQWTQPHYGIHYTVDLETHRLLQAAPFPDSLDPAP